VAAAAVRRAPAIPIRAVEAVAHIQAALQEAILDLNEAPHRLAALHGLRTLFTMVPRHYLQPANLNVDLGEPVTLA